LCFYYSKAGCYNLPMPENMSERRTGIPDSVQAMRNVGAIQPRVDSGLEAAKNFPQPTSINKDVVALGESQLASAKDEFQPMAKNEMPDIRMQMKDDDRDPNKERLEHEMRMQEMGDGKAGYLGAVMSGIRELSQLETDTRDLDMQIFVVRINRARLTDSKDRIPKARSKNLQEARDTLKTEMEGLRDEIVATGGQPKMVEITVRKKDGSKKKETVDAVQKASEDLQRAADFYNTEPTDREKRLEPERERVREKIAEAYVGIIHTSLDEIAALNKYLENLKNPYPYDSRWNLQFFEQALEKINDRLRNKNRFNEEGLALLRMLKRDMLWAQSNARVVEGMGPAFEVYFDGELMLQWVRTPHTELVARDFIRLNKKELKGAELTPDQRALVEKTLSKRPDELMSKDMLGLREKAIEYQDNTLTWLDLSIAAGQKNLEITNAATWAEAEGEKEEGDHYAQIDQVSFIFLQEAMALEDANDIEYTNRAGQKFKVKDKILNPFCMPRGDELANMAYMTRMHELVLNNDQYATDLQAIMTRVGTGPVSDTDRQAIKDIAQRLITAAKAREENWEALDEELPYVRLVDQIVRSRINIEKGLLSGGDMGWTWNYEKGEVQTPQTDARGTFVSLGKVYKDELLAKSNEYIWQQLKSDVNIHVQTDATRGEYIERKVYQKDVDDAEWKELTDPALAKVKRKSEMGSIYENHDVTTVSFLARHIIEYDYLADTRGTGVWIFPSIGHYREEWFENTPYWRPRIEKFAANDPTLLKRLGIDASGNILPSGGILSPNNPLEGKEARKGFKKGEKGVQIQYYGKFDPRARNLVAQNMWAFVVPFLDNPGVQGSDYMVMPIFTPTTLRIGFWNGVSLDKPSAKTNDHKSVSVWHRRMQGKKNSEMAWENMDKYKYSWIRVTHDQLERWLGPIATPHEFNRSTQPEHEKHYNKPGGMSEKEGGKRARLGGRAFEYDDGALRATAFAQNKILAALKLSGIMGLSVKNETELNKEFAKVQNDWVAPWMNTLLDMPSKVRKIHNYPGTSAQVALVTYLQARRIITSMVKHTEGQNTDVSASITNAMSSF
jgi:hypothetical protein